MIKVTNESLREIIKERCTITVDKDAIVSKLFNLINKYKSNEDMKYDFFEIIDELRVKTETPVDLSDLDTSEVTDMSELFKGVTCKTIKGLDNWDTSKVFNMWGMFEDSNLIDIGIYLIGTHLMLLIWLECLQEANLRI